MITSIDDFEAEMRWAFHPVPDFQLIFTLLFIYAPAINQWLDTHHCSVMGNRMTAQRWANVWTLVSIDWEVCHQNPAAWFQQGMMAHRRLKGLGLFR